MLRNKLLSREAILNNAVISITQDEEKNKLLSRMVI